MSNRNTKAKNKPNNQSASTVNNHNYVEIDYDKLAEAIVKADEIRAKKIKEAKDLEFKENLKQYGFKEYDKKYKKYVSDFFVLSKVLIRPNKYINGKNYTGITSIMVVLINSVFLFLEVVCYCFILALLFSALFLDSATLSIWSIMPISILIFAFTRLFIVVRKEVAETKDVNTLATFFITILTVISLVIALIALFKNGGVS